MKQLSFIAIIIVIAFFTVNAQTTEFSYQGALAENGTPANGSYEMQFKLFDSLSGPTQIGSTLTRNPVAVTNGGFAVVLDFGSSAFPGPDRFLAIAVRNLGGGNLTSLSPRNQISSTPYAIRALTVTGPVTGANSVAMLSVSNSQPGITDPSPANLPPAAVRGEATSTLDATIGVVGIAHGANAAGVLGIAPNNGVVAAATATSGGTTGVSAEISSPEGTAFQATGPAGSVLYKGGSKTGPSVFRVEANGQVFGRSFANESGFSVSTSGIVLASGVNAQNMSANSLGVSGPVQLNNGAGIIGNLSINGSLNVTGTKNAVATLPDGRRILLYATESPENWFEDFGTIRLRKGRAFVAIDKTFAQTANVGVPYKVFLTPNGNCRGLYVAHKTAGGFEVRELGGGRSSVAFDYRIVARRKGYEKERFAEAPSTSSAKN